MSSNDIEFEELLKNIYYDKLTLETEKEKILTESKEISMLKENLQKQNEEKERQAKEIINTAKTKARNILLEAKEDANEMIQKLSNATESKEINALRNSLNTKIGNIKLENISSETIDKSKTIDRNAIKPGKEVFVSSVNQNGTVLSNISKNDEVQVQIGSMKMNVKIDLLQNPEKSNNSKKASYSSASSPSPSKNSKSKHIKPEINVIGMNVEEANFVIDKFLDDCSLAKLETVRIIHGKGTGKLKNGIHQFLKNNSHVKSFRLGTFGEGEMGVTVVTLK